MNQKARHIGKRKAGSSVRKCLRKLHTSEYANSCFTQKKILYFKEDTIDLEKLQSVVPSLASRERTVQAAPSKREERKKYLKKGKGKEKKRECERERKEKKIKKGKGKGKGEGRGERERREEERGKNGERGTKRFF